jgi:hypothetical protein
MNDHPTVFETDIIDQTTFYLAAAVALKTIATDEIYPKIVAEMAKAGGPPPPSDLQQKLNYMATLANNTATSLLEENVEGMYYEDNPSMVL